MTLLGLFNHISAASSLPVNGDIFSLSKVYEITGSVGITGSLALQNSDVQITGSLGLSFTGASKYFNIEVNGEEKIKINNEGTLQLLSQSSVPTAVEGGIYYGSDSNLYLGTNT